MMTAFREQVAYVFRIHLIQQIVENYETRFTVLVAEILGKALVKTDVLMLRGQLFAGKGRFLVVTPDDPSTKVGFRTQRIEMLHEAQGKR